MKQLTLLSTNALHVYEGENWTSVNIADALEHITYNEATMLTPASPNTIAAIVHHLFFWNNIIMERLKGIAPLIPEANGFNAGDINSEEQWQQLLRRTKESFEILSNAIKNFPEERLAEISPTGRSDYYSNIQGITEHAYYHLGQIVILKNLVKKII